jgi:SPP1 gp7 family putative phage head morphogenesis protein
VLPRSASATQTRAQQRDVAYGSPEHERLWRAFARRTERQEQKLGKAVADLFKRQQASVIGRLTGRSARSAEEVADTPFSLEEWIKKFRSELRPLLKEIVLEAAEEAWDGLNIGGAFDVTNPEVAKFIEQRVQRFAQLVNQTTYDQLRTSLAVGADAGESIALLTERVNDVMGTRIRSSGETIARTEVIGASNGGALWSYQESGVVEKKAWLAALDDRTRETHREAHGQTVGLEDDFEVGGAFGPAPGQMGKADEDVNCRCAIRPVLGD